MNWFAIYCGVLIGLLFGAGIWMTGRKALLLKVLLALLVALVAPALWAQTDAQLPTIKAAIVADPELNAYPNTSDGNYALAICLNTGVNVVCVPATGQTPDPAGAAFWVYRTQLTEAEVTQAASVDATTWNWTGTGFITRSQGERDAWARLFQTGACNPSLANVRQAFSDIMSGGTPPAPANRTHLSAMARRIATRAEKILATGTGSTGSPAVMGFEGHVSYQKVGQARDLP